MDLTGQQFGEYKLERLLGQGGMAAVYESFQQSVNRKVAVKVLPPQLAQEPGYLERFRREVEVAAHLEHINIVPIYDYGAEDRTSYVVMRLLTGGTLMDRLEQGALNPREARRILMQIGEALDYAHQRGVIHRDIKASNILFDEQDNAYLADFGIAKVVGASPLTSIEQIIGTPHYMAPELWEGIDVDHRVDIYALGVLAYQMFTGHLPFTADTPYAIMGKHLNEKTTPITVHVNHLPERLNEVIDKALAKLPDERYQTVMEFVIDVFEAVTGRAYSGRLKRNDFDAIVEEADQAALKPITTEYDISPPPVESQKVMPAQPAPNRSGWLVGAAAVAILLVIGAVLLIGGGDEEPENDNENVAVVTEEVTEEIAAAITEIPTEAEPTVAPSETPSETPTATETTTITPTASATDTPRPTDTPTLTPTATPEFFVVTRNADWTPLLREFGGVQMALVPPGCFQMGSESGQSDEAPVHEQCFEEAFWLDVTEVTNVQYGSSGTFAGDMRPRDSVSWLEAVAYCESQGKRLPNEAEWEYAARGPESWLYPWGNEFVRANVIYRETSGRESVDVGSAPGGASWVGALDLVGNLREWVSSPFNLYPFDPVLEGDQNALRVMRGGSWDSIPEELTATDRNRNVTTFSTRGLGFRCAMDYEAP